jgi:hypothetical protein
MTDDGTVRLASPAAEEYLDGVRAALADLPAPEVAEILDDVRAHLADLTAELGGEVDVAALTARLGPPSAYAAELRAAAGYPPAGPAAAAPRHARARLALAAPVAGALLFLLGAAAGTPVIVFVGLLVAVLGLPLVIGDGPQVPSVAALPEVRRLAAARPAEGTPARRLADFVAGLQSAWWIVRAIAAATLVVAILSGGGAPAVLLLALVAVPVSVWVGHLTRRDRRWLWGVVPLNALAAVVVLWMLTAGVPGAYDGGSASSYPAFQPGLWQDSEREIRDIRPVDADGNPLTGVYLFDQDGLPIDTSGGAECGATDGPGSGSNAAYPRGTWDFDPRTGRCRHTPPAPLVVAVPTTPAPGGMTGPPAVPTQPVPPPVTPPTR